MTPSNEPEDAARGRTQLLAAVLLVCGLVLIAISFVWPRVTSAESHWTQEQAREYQAAALHLHQLAPEVKKLSQQNGDRQGREAISKAKADYDSLRAELESAASRPNRIANIFRLAGIVLAVAGAIGFFYGRTLSDR